ncbi:PrpF domain-containing protein [Thalassospira sp. CH_XMU1458]|uniref:PrpF domain-containing protein n=1 Tax=Thalassospira sp. CH_XMU1458 TaxID=3107776 RepID=UPI00300C4132
MPHATSMDLCKRLISGVDGGGNDISSSITGGMRLATTMELSGPVAHELAGPNTNANKPLTIAHPSGTLALDADISGSMIDDFTVNAVTVFRTARHLMQGEAMMPRHRISEDAEG